MLRKLRKHKKAIELSINFIVMLILAVAMFSGGLVFLKKFFSKTGEMKDNLDSQTEQQIEKLLDSGSPVVIPVHTKSIYRSKSDTFGIGVLSDEAIKYVVEFEAMSAYDKEKNPISGDAISWLSFADDTSGKIKKTIAKGKKEKFLVLVDVPSNAVKGTYPFKVTVYKESTKDENIYDFPVEMIVQVP